MSAWSAQGPVSRGTANPKYTLYAFLTYVLQPLTSLLFVTLDNDDKKQSVLSLDLPRALLSLSLYSIQA